jgi:hypothetical protein
MATRNWFVDFKWTPTAVIVKKTGARVPFDRETIEEVLAWFAFFFAVRAAKRPRHGPKVAFYPDVARPWYLVWPVLHLAGARTVSSPATADLIFRFEDATVAPDVKTPATGPHQRLVNAGCDDVSKTRVAEAFETAFGYPLALDPRTHRGAAVEKSEENGVHDGRIVQCPTEPLPGKVYQRLVDAISADGMMDELRCPTVGGKPVVIFNKRRTADLRFTNHNAAVRLLDPTDHFSADEFAAIARFCALMGMDWGGLDILRDHGDRRIYIVDANKTDMGPPTALPLKEKMASVRALAEAFLAWTAEKR